MWRGLIVNQGNKVKKGAGGGGGGGGVPLKDSRVRSPLVTMFHWEIAV